MSTKETNPKDAIGCQKPPVSTIPWPAVFEAGAGMLEGACKYGRHNYRVIGVRSSIYFDAVMRHLAAWWEGEDIDPESGIHHVGKAISSLLVLRDAQMQGNIDDDRPPRFMLDGDSPLRERWLARLEDQVRDILERYPRPEEPYREVGGRPHGDDDWEERPYNQVGGRS